MKYLRKTLVLLVVMALLMAVAPTAFAETIDCTDLTSKSHTFKIENSTGFLGTVAVNDADGIVSDYSVTFNDEVTYNNGTGSIWWEIEEDTATLTVTVTVNFVNGKYGECTVSLNGNAQDANYAGATYSSSVTMKRTAPHVCDMDNLTDVDEVPATCTSTGVKAHQKCDCGKLYLNGVEVTADDLVISKLGHDFENGTVIDHKDATCTADGYTTTQCARCEATDTETHTKLGHDFKNGTVVDHKDATCTEAGYTTTKCARCEATDTVTHAKLGHNYVLDSYVKPTAEKDGSRTYKCTRCGDTYTEVWKYGKVPSTGDITPMLYATGFGVFSLFAAVAYVFKRKFVR